MLTRYQQMIIRYLEAEYKMSADKVIRWLHKRNRYSDIAKLIGCSENTLFTICKKLGIDESPTRTSYTPTYLNATEFFKQFKNVEDAIVECRDRLGLSVEDTVKKLGIGRSTVVRYTPDYLKYTFNHSKDKKERSAGLPSADHPWRQ